MLNKSVVFATGLALVLTLAGPAFAYIGPGAGFTLLSSFMAVTVAFFTAFLALLTFPVRWLLRAVRRRRLHTKPKVKKVIILGLDGLDPTICEDLMNRGELPAFTRLKATGSFRRLGTTTPAMSPVAWSTYATGVDASRHGIFDFLARDTSTYLPVLSSSVITGGGKFLELGPFRIPTKKGGLRFLRRSQSFWKILGDHGIFSSVLRVPITFPPEKIYGVMLSAMCVPDLRGTMGSFTYFTTSSAAEKIGGMVIKLGPAENGSYRTRLDGPPSPFNGRPISLPLTITPNPKKGGATISVGKNRFFLEEKRYSPWQRLSFKAAPGLSLGGIAKFYITQLNGSFGLYVTPIHIDPAKPAVPISSPAFYSVYLARLLGSYATLGLAEDTWALNERVIDERAFLEQAYAFHDERKKMWRRTLKKQKKGFITCVFDLSDRLQHMFFRYLLDDHSANTDKDTTFHREALHDMYREMDRLVAETLEYVDERTAFFVISDHGFKPFLKGVNTNSWLHEHGYLFYKDGAERGEYLQGVDWSRTRAYALGLGGIYLNKKGREHYGIVEESECADLKAEISRGLLELEDEQGPLINRMIDVARDFSGPYRHGGPDLLVGFRGGVRVSWDCARGLVTSEVVEDNRKSWSGDHCMDPDTVPGVLFSNRPAVDPNPRLIDIGPTVLELFGIKTPPYMKGRNILEETK